MAPFTNVSVIKEGSGGLLGRQTARARPSGQVAERRRLSEEYTHSQTIVVGNVAGDGSRRRIHTHKHPKGVRRRSVLSDRRVRSTVELSE